MTVYLWPDESRPVFFRFTGELPKPAEVNLGIPGDELWHPITVEGNVGTMLVCGPTAAPPGSGYVRVQQDCCPRIRDANGAMHTDGWFRIVKVRS